jgi:SAM-dependent methyltransferase
VNPPTDLGSAGVTTAPEAGFCIKHGYVARAQESYFDDEPYATSAIVHQPDAYALAGFLAARYRAEAIIDIGCGVARKLMALPDLRKVGVDFGPNLRYCQRSYPNEAWIEADLESARDLPLADDLVARSVVICADVIEHLADPTCLLTLLADLSRRACAVVISTPERDLVRGGDDMGPPANPAHVREWNIGEFETLLTRHALAPTFLGLTVNNDQDLEKQTILAVVDRTHPCLTTAVPDDFRPLAIVATYNEGDILVQTTGKLLDDGIDVHVLDNWSTDGSFEALKSLVSSRARLVVERFPESGPTQYYEWRRLLERKKHIAQHHPGRWIIHHDSDEVRCSPWRGMSFRAGLHVADRMGFNAVDFTVCEFRPVDESFAVGLDPETAFSFFEFARRYPADFVQTGPGGSQTTP